MAHIKSAISMDKMARVASERQVTISTQIVTVSAEDNKDKETPDAYKLTKSVSKLGVKESRLARMAMKKGFMKFSKILGTVASNVLTAYLGFKDPKRRKREYLIPKDRAAWLEWMVTMAKRRINVKYLMDRELRKVIIRARPNLSPHKKYQGPVVDPDLPSCINWNEHEVGDWIVSIGWPQLRETFTKNLITGRRLVLMDCTALNKMGMTDLASMREVAGKIRDLLGIPPPNGLRAIMRVPPFERFLRRKVYSGRGYDEMTFEKFCAAEGYHYEPIHANKNSTIPCTCEVVITKIGTEDLEEDGDEDENDEELSLRNAPTVEFLARNALVRNKTVDQIMSDILESVFLPPSKRKYGRDVWTRIKRGIGEGYDDLHLYYAKEKLEFASGVANALLDELYKTATILNDITQLRQHIKENISDEEVEFFQNSAQILLEDAAPIAGLLALGELELESIFKQQPEFERYVDGVIKDAEKKTNELVPEASAFIDTIITDATKRIPKMDLSKIPPGRRESILRFANESISGVHNHPVEKHDAVVTESSHHHSLFKRRIEKHVGPSASTRAPGKR